MEEAVKSASAEHEPSDSCPSCKGRGDIESGLIVDGIGGPGYETFPCTDCRGTGEIFPDDHDTFKWSHGTTVNLGGIERVVFFDYEGDGCFNWAFPNDKECLGPSLTKDERQSVDEQINAWYDDWCSWDPENHL